MSRYPFLVLPLLLHSSMLPQVVRSQINGNARSCSCHQRCPAAAVQQMPTRATSHSDTSNWLSPPQPLLPDRQPHCSAFSSAAVRGDTATARACSSRSGEDGSTGGRHAARRQGQQQRLCFARACARLVPVERGAGRPAGRSGQGGWVVICPTASDRATALRCRLGRPRARPCPRLKTLLYVRFVHLRAPVRARIRLFGFAIAFEGSKVPAVSWRG
jgi:hypothetical protein